MVARGQSGSDGWYNASSRVYDVTLGTGALRGTSFGLVGNTV